MTALHLDITLALLSFITFISVLGKIGLRTRKERNVEQTVGELKKHLKRRIILLTAEDKTEGILQKTIGSVHEWVSRRRVVGGERREVFLEAKKLQRKADVYIGRGELTQAEKYLIEALSLDETNKEINKKLALLYLKQKKYPKAELIYLKLIELGSRDPTVYSNLGLVLYNEGRLDMAIKAYQKATDLDPKRPMRFANIGQIFYELQDINNAVSHFEKAYALDTKNIDYMFILAKLYEEKNIKEKAKYFYHKILDIEPYNEEAKEGIRNLL